MDEDRRQPERSDESGENALNMGSGLVMRLALGAALGVAIGLAIANVAYRIGESRQRIA